MTAILGSAPLEMNEPPNNALEQTTPRGLMVATLAVERRAHSRTGAAGHAGRSLDSFGV